MDPEGSKTVILTKVYSKRDCSVWNVFSLSNCDDKKILSLPLKLFNSPSQVLLQWKTWSFRDPILHLLCNSVQWKFKLGNWTRGRNKSLQMHLKDSFHLLSSAPLTFCMGDYWMGSASTFGAMFLFSSRMLLVLTGTGRRLVSHTSEEPYEWLIQYTYHNENFFFKSQCSDTQTYLMVFSIADSFLLSSLSLSECKCKFCIFGSCWNW